MLLHPDRDPVVLQACVCLRDQVCQVERDVGLEKGKVVGVVEHHGHVGDGGGVGAAPVSKEKTFSITEEEGNNYQFRAFFAFL